MGKKVALPAVVKVETFEDTDIGSGVAQVTVNGVVAVRQQPIGAANETWIAAQVPVDVALKTIQVEATDTIGNVSTLAEVGVNVLEFGAYDTEESGLAPANVNTTYEVLTADFNNDGLMDILELAHGSDASGEPTSRCHWQQENGRFLTQAAQECGLPEFNDVSALK